MAARIRTTPRRQGLRGHPLYSVWAGVKNRCYNANEPRYPDYGGRGIAVCAEWRTSFPVFLEWATAAGWAPGLQIDRADNDGDYAPQNCRFVTAAVNSQNRRTTRLSAETVAAVKRDLRSGEKPCVIRRRHGLNSVDLYQIKSGRRWRSIL